MLIVDIRVVDASEDSSLARSIAPLLADSAWQLTRFLRCPIRDAITVVISSSDTRAPITLYREQEIGPITILLSATGGYWCQYVYQFAHELCHVISRYERLKANPNNWLHESLCELASIFVLKGMAVQWTSQPTFPGREGYASKIESYVVDAMSRDGTHLAAGETLSEWVIAKEAELRREPVTLEKQRLNQSLIAYELLPLFCSHPSGWNAVTHLPASTAQLKEYLEEWHSNVEADDKEFVSNIAKTFGFLDIPE